MRKKLFFLSPIVLLLGCGQLTAEELFAEVCRGEITNLNNVDLSDYTRTESDHARRLLTVHDMTREKFGSSEWAGMTPERRCDLTKGHLLLLPSNDASAIADSLFNKD